MIMSESAQRPKAPKKFDISVSGYFLTPDMIARLCVRVYGASSHIVDNMGPLDTAIYYFERRSAVEAPTLIRVH